MTGCSCASRMLHTKLRQSGREMSPIGVQSRPSPGKSGAMTVWPRLSSRDTSLYQHQAPCHAPWMRTYVLIETHPAPGLERRRYTPRERRYVLTCELRCRSWSWESLWASDCDLCNGQNRRVCEDSACIRQGYSFQTLVQLHQEAAG